MMTQKMNNGCSNALRALNRLAIALLLWCSVATGSTYGQLAVKKGSFPQEIHTNQIGCGYLRENTIAIVNGRTGIPIAVNHQKNKLKIKFYGGDVEWYDVSAHNVYIPTIDSMPITKDDTNLMYKPSTIGGSKKFKLDDEPVRRGGKIAIRRCGSHMSPNLVRPNDKELTRSRKGENTLYSDRSPLPTKKIYSKQTVQKDLAPTEKVDLKAIDAQVWRPKRQPTREERLYGKYKGFINDPDTLKSQNKSLKEAIAFSFDKKNHDEMILGILISTGGNLFGIKPSNSKGSYAYHDEIKVLTTSDGEPIRLRDTDLEYHYGGTNYGQITIKQPNEWIDHQVKLEFPNYNNFVKDLPLEHMNCLKRKQKVIIPDTPPAKRRKIEHDPDKITVEWTKYYPATGNPIKPYYWKQGETEYKWNPDPDATWVATIYYGADRNVISTEYKYEHIGVHIATKELPRKNDDWKMCHGLKTNKQLWYRIRNDILELYDGNQKTYPTHGRRRLQVLFQRFREAHGETDPPSF